ncbi:hypothetical protein EV356DRAFT_565271 [Neofusicoccum parvum]|uniref:Uncharacterized protein n=1 Tax=Neofusicoccum parvum TaxID=310453 RepID=A0ACB5RSA9_9PEZI|nr:hypothetical protein EV356DRAFT_565271 [Neofusicoccum parvum]
MQTKTLNLILAFSSAFCAAAPANPSTSDGLVARGDLYTTKSGITVGTDDGEVIDTKKAKRNVLYTTNSGITVGTLSDDEINNDLVRREDWNDADAPEVDMYDDEPLSSQSKRADKTDYVSSCGPKSGWTPIYDPSTTTWGYRSAAQAFCHRVYTDDYGNPLLIPSKGYASSNIVFENEYSNDGKRVTLKNGVAGYIEFEIHNKSGAQLRVIESDCVRFLMKMADSSSDCYGSDNIDTKGGTWQDGSSSSGISYHGLPKQGNPA